MRPGIPLITAFLIALILCGCSGRGTNPNKIPLAKVGDETIYVDELLKNPSFVGMVDQIIKSKIIEQEYATRGFKLTPERFKKEWDSIVLAQAQGDEKAFRAKLAEQGITDEFVNEQIRMKIMYTDVVLSEYPITPEDIRAEFESNKSRYQRMYVNQVPGKTNWEDITLEDIQEQVKKSIERKTLTEQGSALLDVFYDEYQEKGWIKNLLTPDDPNALTIIKPKTTDGMKEMKPETLKQQVKGPEETNEEKVEENKNTQSDQEAKPSDGDNKDESSSSEDKTDDEEKQPDNKDESGNK
jgi:hypothetical protein